MILKSLTALTVLCLTACGTHTVRDGSPASDLAVLVGNVRSDGKPILLPNGKEYCLELAETENAQDECAGDLEDALYKSNRARERQVRTVETFATGEARRRNPCNALQRAFLKRCRD